MSKNNTSRISKNCDNVKTTYNNWFLFGGLIIVIIGSIFLYYAATITDQPSYPTNFFTGLILGIIGIVFAFISPIIANNRKKKCEQTS